MKTLNITSLSFFILSIYTTHYSLFLLGSSSAAAAELHEPVYDREGQPLRAGNRYYAYCRKYNASLTERVGVGGTCLVSVSIEDSFVDRGIPVIFGPVIRNPVGEIVRVSTDTDIIFATQIDECLAYGIEPGWTLIRDEATGEDLVMAGTRRAGLPRNPETSGDNRFQIKKAGTETGRGAHYKFAFCPTPTTCRDVGIFAGRRLALIIDGQDRLAASFEFSRDY